MFKKLLVFCLVLSASIGMVTPRKSFAVFALPIVYFNSENGEFLRNAGYSTAGIFVFNSLFALPYMDADVGGKSTAKDWMAVITALSVVILDSKATPLPSNSELTDEDADKIGISDEDREAFNSDRETLDALNETILEEVSGLSPELRPEAAKKIFEENAEDKLQEGTRRAINLIAREVLPKLPKAEKTQK